MLNLEEINNTITELENGHTTYENCLKLASLYIVKQNLHREKKSDTGDFSRGHDDVVKEYSDILSAYSEYCDTKRRYQMNEISIRKVLQEMKNVCDEIVEFIRILYSNSDVAEERQQIVNMISQLDTLY